MLNIPAALFTKYSLLLNNKSVLVSVHNNYKKWLRYFLDFHSKYHFLDSSSKSLKQFLCCLLPKDKQQPR